MGNTNKRIEVQRTKPERYFSRCYHDFMDCKLLSGEEKIVYLTLKRFLDIRLDDGDIFPSIETIQEMTGWGNKKVIKYINSLVKKGIVKKIQRGLNKPNLYTIADNADMWQASSLEEIKDLAQESEVNKAIRILQTAGYTVMREEKEKGLDSEPTKAHYQAPQTSKTPHNSTLLQGICQDPIEESPKPRERYTLNQVHKIFGYEAMVHDNPLQKKDIDFVMDILHTILTTTKPTIHIAGANRPIESVIAKLMKLTSESIMYIIGKYQEQKGSISKEIPYMRTILYTAPEQYELYIQNQYAQHNN